MEQQNKIDKNQKNQYEKASYIVFDMGQSLINFAQINKKKEIKTQEANSSTDR